MDIGHFVIMALFWNIHCKLRLKPNGDFWMKMHLHIDMWKSQCVAWCSIGYGLFGSLFKWISQKMEGQCAVTVVTEVDHKMVPKTAEKTIVENLDNCLKEIRLSNESKDLAQSLKFDMDINQVTDVDADMESCKEDEDCSTHVDKKVEEYFLNPTVNNDENKMSVSVDWIPEPANAAYGINFKLPRYQEPTSVDSNYMRDILEVLKRQADITEMLLKVHNMAKLPKRDVPVFTGDPLDYRPFVKAFTHVIASNTDNDLDKLYYLEQYTRGDPQMLVKSCQHMPPSQGYAEAIRLLEDFYGHPFKIATALMDKLFEWPEIQAEDAKAFSSFSIFLVSCNNIMQEVDCMNELDSPTNLKIGMSKLPYKTREKWREYAFDISENQTQQVKFVDFVSFVTREARIINDPVFGDLQSSVTEWKGKRSVVSANVIKANSSKDDFAIAVNTSQEETNFGNDFNTKRTAFAKPCFYCRKSHTFTECHNFASKPHPERLKILRKAGMCFSCLIKGHLSKNCKNKLGCPVCLKEHPKVLHIYKAHYSKTMNTGCQTENSGDTIISGVMCSNQVPSTSNGAGCTYTLPMMPVCFETAKENKTVDTHVKRHLSDRRCDNGPSSGTVENTMDFSELYWEKQCEREKRLKKMQLKKMSYGELHCYGS